MGAWSRYKYRALLLTVLLLVVVHPILQEWFDTALVFNLLLTTVFVVGVWVVFSDRPFRLVGFALAAPALLGAWVGYALPDLPVAAVAVVFHLAAALFYLCVVVVLLRSVYRGPVTPDQIAGALCGYVLVGAAFGHAYCLLVALAPGAIHGVGSGSAEQVQVLLTYFSMMTLTTVGYGDITPASSVARALTVVEAVIGQFYLAVLVADLVGKKVSQVLSAGPPPPG